MPKYRVLITLDEQEIIEASSAEEAKELAYDPCASIPDIFVEELDTDEVAELEEGERCGVTDANVPF